MPIKGIVGYAAAQLEKMLEIISGIHFQRDLNYSISIDELLPRNATRDYSRLKSIESIFNEALQKNGFLSTADENNQDVSYASIRIEEDGAHRYKLVVRTNALTELFEKFDEIADTASEIARERDRTNRGEGPGIT